MGKFYVEIITLPERVVVEREWLQLEAQCHASFFTSWAWIGCWLDLLAGRNEPKLLRVRSGGQVVGLGLLSSFLARRHGLITARTLCLNIAGDPLKDEITIERNGFLLHEQFAEGALREIYRFLADDGEWWEELRLDGMMGDHAWLSREHPELRVIPRERRCYFVNLDEAKARGSGYLGMLSQNSRAQVRRSLKEYSKLGTVRATVAETLDDAFAYLDALKQFHQIYWTSRGKPGSFSNTFFETFHRRLVRERFEFGEIQLIRIDAGGRDIGYLYNFVYDGRVSNYQSGFDYGVCEKHNRPGLVAHAMAVDLNIALEQRIYDFLAGDYQYKRMLGTHSEPMTWIVLQRDRLKFRAEEGLRRLKRRIQGSSRLGNGAASAGGVDE